MKSAALIPVALLALLPGAGLAQDAAPSGRPVRTSLFSDRLPVFEGSIVTILVDEFTLTEANRDDSSNRDRQRNVGANVNAAGTRTGGGLDTRNDLLQRQQAGASRTDRFRAEISVRVVELDANGLARIEGTKKMQIDDHEQEVVVRGWIRTADVRPGNTIESWRVADAELLYTSNGKIVKSGGIWDMLFKWIVP